MSTVKPLRDSVACVLFHESWQGELLAIRRQNHLVAFPGYTSFPGGKVDKKDRGGGIEKEVAYLEICGDSNPEGVVNALFREIEEELGILLRPEQILDFKLLGEASTPEFNNVRFHTYFYGIVLKERPDFRVDAGEIASYAWKSALKWREEYNKGNVLAVVPTLKVFEFASSESFLQFDFESESPRWDLNISYDPDREVPMLETIVGVRQFLPRSLTLPPADRTNCFLIGDQRKVLIDPSPKDEGELSRLINSVEKYLAEKKLEMIFITHHHTDHYQFANKLARRWGVPLGMSRDTHQRISQAQGEKYFDGIVIAHFQEGDTLTESCSWPVNVYEVPGHDRGQLALGREDRCWFLAGDLFQTIGTVVVGGEEGDMAEYFNSLEKVIAWSPRYSIPSHGMAVGGTYKIEQTLKHRQMREQKVAELLALNYGVDEIYQSIYRAEGLPDKLEGLAKMTIQAHIEKLRRENV